MIRSFVCATALCGFVLGLGARPVQAQNAPIVLELFTSQGCSSCPPADRVLEDLAQDASLIPLSLPVDYWDSLGWKDVFAMPAFTQRQKTYAAMKAENQIYTPQIVIQG